MTDEDDWSSGKADAKTIASFDRELQEFRLVWSSADMPERQKLKKWLIKAKELQQEVEWNWRMAPGATQRREPFHDASRASCSR